MNPEETTELEIAIISDIWDVGCGCLNILGPQSIMLKYCVPLNHLN
jgi:hypothetical protein